MGKTTQYGLKLQSEHQQQPKRWYEHTLAKTFVSPILIVGPLLTSPNWKSAAHQAGMQFTMLTLGTYLMQQHFYGEKMMMKDQDPLAAYLEALANMGIGMGVSMYAYESTISLFTAVSSCCKRKPMSDETIPLTNVQSKR